MAGNNIFSFQYKLPPQNQTYGHEYEIIPIKILDPKYPVIKNFKLFYSIDKIFEYRELFSQYPRWMDPNLPIPSGSTYKVKIRKISQKNYYSAFFLYVSSRPEIDVNNNFWVRCCGHVAQSELHRCFGKKWTYTIEICFKIS